MTELLGGARLAIALAVATPLALALLALGWGRRGTRALGALGVTCCLLGVYAHWGEPRWRKRTVVALPWRGPALRIVLLSDLHAQPDGAAAMRDVVEATLAEQPDVILLGGDFVEGNDADPRKLASLEPLRSLSAPLGVLAVLGNHDSEADVGDPGRRDAIVARLRALGIRVLHNEHVRLANGVVVTGLGDWRAEESDAARAFAAENPDAPAIVLVHNFQSLRSPWVGRFDLALAGHTHGGQACIPGTGICPFLEPDMQPYRYGLFDWPAGGKLYVTSGLGTSGVRARLGARPEVAVLEMAAATTKSSRGR